MLARASLANKQPEALVTLTAEVHAQRYSPSTAVTSLRYSWRCSMARDNATIRVPIEAAMYWTLMLGRPEAFVDTAVKLHAETYSALAVDRAVDSKSGDPDPEPVRSYSAVLHWPLRPRRHPLRDMARTASLELVGST